MVRHDAVKLDHPQWTRWVMVVLVGVAISAAHLWHHPFAFEGSLRGIAPGWPRLGKLLGFAHAFLGLFALDAAALVIGRAILRRDPDLVARLTLGLLVLAQAVFALAALHVLVEPAIIVLVALPILIALPATLRELRSRAAAAPRFVRVRPAVLALVAALAVLPILEAFVPRYGWDALTYHLALPERYLHAHAIDFTPLSLYSAFPLTVEMLYAAAMALAGPSLAKLVNLQFGMLALVVVWRLARRRSLRAAMLAVGIGLADPLLRWELGVAYNDLPLCACALLACEAAFSWLEDPAAPSLLRLAVFGGACLGIRVPGALVPVVLGLLVVSSFRRLGARRVLYAGFAIAAASSLSFLPWLARNAVFSGDPFSPALQGWFGAPYFDPVVIRQMMTFSSDIGIGRGLAAVLRLPYVLFVTSSNGRYTGAFGFEVGPLYLVGVLAALATPEVRRDAWFRRSLIAAALLLAGWFLSSQEARYLLPALLLVAPAGGAALDAISEGASRIARGLVYGLVGVGLLLAQAPALGQLPASYGVALGAIEPDAVEAREDAARLAARLRSGLPKGRRLLLLLESRSFFFRGLDFLPYHVLEGSPVLRLIHDAPDARALRCRVEALGATDVVVNLAQARGAHPLPTPEYGAAEYVADLGKLQAFLGAWAEPYAREGEVIAARLRPVDCR